MKNHIIHINIGVCSSWGTKLPKHIFYTQHAPKHGHRYCLNCGMTKAEARADGVGTIENRIVDINCDFKNPVFITCIVPLNVREIKKQRLMHRRY